MHSASIRYNARAATLVCAAIAGCNLPSLTEQIDKSKMISAVILNWSRPGMLVKVILPVLERYSCVSEIVISHGKKSTAFDYESRHCRITHREDWELDKKWGIRRRLIAAKEASNEIIWSQDDDLLVPEETIKELLFHYRRQPNVLHGLVGKQFTLTQTSPSPQFIYTADLALGSVILLGGASVLCKRDSAERCFAPEHQAIHDFVRENTCNGNVEDIIHSLATFKNSGLPNKSYDFPYFDLSFVANQGEAISSQLGHIDQRTALLNYAVEKMGLQEKASKFAEKKKVNPYIRPPGSDRNWVRKVRRLKERLTRWTFYFLLTSKMHLIKRMMLKQWAEKHLRRSRYRRELAAHDI